VGGAKVSDKLGVVRYFWKRADDFLIGGSPANTFLEAEGMDVGDSLVDTDAVPMILPYLNAKKIHLPEDVKYRSTKILDIGPKTVKAYAEMISRSKTIVWNGPMGWFERKGFGNGTRGIWKAILGNKKAHIVVGGGETVTSLRALYPKRCLPGSNIFLSTGGGAMLDYLSGKKLPGIEALK
jgi:phosphoglycerate kinase